MALSKLLRPAALCIAACCVAEQALAQTPTPGETYPPGAIRVVPADLAKYWLVNNSSLEADAPIGGKNMDQPSCASVTYLIEADGKTSHIHLDKVVPPGDLGQVAISVVKALHYAPGPQNGARSPVLTRVVFPFNMPQAAPGNKEQGALVAAQKERILAACEPEPPKPQKKP
jgi:hypothetical protein